MLRPAAAPPSSVEVVGDAAAPTIDDARRAGRALADAGAREVMVFGSVAKGEARLYSDIDLVVVLDDLDYRSRRDTAYALEDLAADAVGRSVDVWLTDVPEWAAQNRCAASFAAAIRADLTPVAVRDGDDSAICWDKEQVMATSDTEAAWRRLEEVRTQLQRLARRHHPDDRERQARAAGRVDDHHDLQADRLVEACTAAAMAIESAFKALGTEAQIDPGLLHYNHRIGLIVDELSKGDQVAAGMIFTGAVTAQNVSAWRTLGDYQPGPDEPHPHELATAAYTTAVAAAAAAAAGYAADKMASLHGRRVVNDSIDALTGELRQLAVTVDIATGEPPQPDPGTDLSAAL